MIKIYADHCSLIGDALSGVQWMKYLCDEHRTDALVVGGFNHLVADLLEPSYPFIYAAEDLPGDYAAIYHVNVAELLRYSGQVHMCQSFFKAAGKPLPELPLTLDLRCEPSGLKPGVVVAPYSRSDFNHNKFWPHDRWISVIRALRDGGQIDRVYVVGASGVDDPCPYVAEDVEPVFDRPLSQVLSLMRSSPLVMTIDTGISHLAHYGGVENHVLLSPGSAPECLVPNPCGSTVRVNRPIEAQPSDMLQAARMVLGRPSPMIKEI